MTRKVGMCLGGLVVLAALAVTVSWFWPKAVVVEEPVSSVAGLEKPAYSEEPSYRDGMKEEPVHRSQLEGIVVELDPLMVYAELPSYENGALVTIGLKAFLEEYGAAEEIALGDAISVVYGGGILETYPLGINDLRELSVSGKAPEEAYKTAAQVHQNWLDESAWIIEQANKDFPPIPPPTLSPHATSTPGARGDREGEGHRDQS